MRGSKLPVAYASALATIGSSHSFLLPPVRFAASEMRRYLLYGALVESAIELPAIAAPATGSVDCTMRLVPRAPVDGVRWFHAWRYPRCAPSVMFGRGADGYVVRVPHAGEFSVSIDGASLQAPSAMPISSAQHLLADLVLPLALSRQRDLLLHASTVHLPDVGAVAIAGASGRGKSSLAAALTAHGAAVLSDDCTAVEQSNGSAAVLPGYPGLRLWPESLTMLAAEAERAADTLPSGKVRIGAPRVPFCSYASDLRAILVLSKRHREGRLKVRRVSRRVAVVQLMRHVFIMDVTDRSQLSRVFSATTSLVERVPVLRIALPDDPAWLDDAAESVVTLVCSMGRNRRSSAARQP
jgi:hypothetical protein